MTFRCGEFSAKDVGIGSEEMTVLTAGAENESGMLTVFAIFRVVNVLCATDANLTLLAQ